MNNWDPNRRDLDALIEAALRDQALVPAPPGLHGRITERIALAALEQKARARFRNTILSGFVAGAAAVFTAGLLLALTNFHLLLDHGVSGGLGVLDYYAATFQFWWPTRLDGTYLLVSLALGVLTVWAGLQALWKQREFRPLRATRARDVFPGRPLRMR